MSELEKMVLNLINEGKTLNQIRKCLHLSNSELSRIFRNLKNKGMKFKQQYYQNGEIISSLEKSLEKPERFPKEKEIILDRDKDEFQAILIADTHIGSIYERLDLLDKVFDFCIKDGINIIIHGGDLTDGLAFGYPKKHSDYYSQINYFLKRYPFDKRILTFAILGNHDMDSLVHEGIDLEQIINNERLDIVPLGYRQGAIKIKNDRFFVFHPLNEANTFEILDWNKLERKQFIITGHQHFMTYYEHPKFIKIYVPAISDIAKVSDKDLPSSFLKMTLKLDNGSHFQSGQFEQFILEPKIIRVSEAVYSLYPVKEETDDYDGTHLVKRKNKN